VSSIEVDRPGNKLRITIRTSRPGIIIGRKGAEIEKLKSDLAKKTKREVFIDIQEVHRPELDAQLVSESIALQLEKRVAFRRAMRKSVSIRLCVSAARDQGSRFRPSERGGNRTQ
jgi:small subunit ribosomal protein S3